jgi:hypothetical protein
MNNALAIYRGSPRHTPSRLERIRSPLLYRIENLWVSVPGSGSNGVQERFSLECYADHPSVVGDD